MMVESIETEAADSLVKMVERIVVLGGTVVDEASNVVGAASASNALKNTKFAEWIPKKTLLRKAHDPSSVIP